jgi:hypothetical protein
MTRRKFYDRNIHRVGDGLDVESRGQGGTKCYSVGTECILVTWLGSKRNGGRNAGEKRMYYFCPQTFL